MSLRLQWLFHGESGVTRRDVIRWWEDRRSSFNAYVGATGIASWLLVLIAGSAAVKPGGRLRRTFRHVSWAGSLRDSWQHLLHPWMDCRRGCVLRQPQERAVPCGIRLLDGVDRDSWRLGSDRVSDDRLHRPKIGLNLAARLGDNRWHACAICRELISKSLLQFCIFHAYHGRAGDDCEYGQQPADS